MMTRLHLYKLRGIRLQLTLWYSLIFILLFLLAAGAFYVALKLTLNVQLDSALQDRAQRIATGISWEQKKIVIRDVTDTLPGATPVIVSDGSPDAASAIWVQVLDRQGKPIYASPAFQAFHRSLLPADSITMPLAGKVWRDSARLGKGVNIVRFVSLPLTEHGYVYGVLQVGQSFTLVTTTLSFSAIIMLLLAPFLLFFGTVISYWLAGRAFAPVRHLTQLAAEVQAGNDLQRRIPVPMTHDEIQELALTLNTMLSRLETAFAVQRRFIADASHDLRTPVAAILSLAENVRDGVEGAECGMAVADIAHQAHRLRQLITNLLQLSRADEGRLQLECEPVYLDRLVQDVVASLQPLAEEHQLTLRTGILDEAVVRGDFAHLLLVLMNLVDNALAYTPIGGEVVLSVLSEVHGAILQVQDTGIGIAASDLSHVFERFYRADPARQRATGGNGLGLAIVQTIVEAHEGTVQVTSTVGQGTTFHVFLPE